MRYDEARLLRNIIERDWVGLTRPLDYEQGAPIGFLWLHKLFWLLGGLNEYTLRLPTLLAGIATLWLTWQAARRLAGERAAFLAAALLGLNPLLLLYSPEFKQYAFDALATALCLWSYAWITLRPQGRAPNWPLLALGGLFCSR